MNSHTTSLALIETEALTPADKSARVVSVALETCPAAVVARRLGCTPDRELLRRAGVVKPGEDKGAR